jgi:hypothetical protein
MDTNAKTPANPLEKNEVSKKSRVVASIDTTYHRKKTNVAATPPNARLLPVVEPLVPMIVITNRANQNTVSIVFNIIYDFVLAHRLSRSMWVVII